MIVKNELVLDEFRGVGPCEWCGISCLRDACHIYSVGSGQLDCRWNLVAMGSFRQMACVCHRKHHDGGRPTQADLLGIAAKREGMTVAEITEKRNLLLRTPGPKNIRVVKRKKARLDPWKCFFCNKTMTNGGVETRRGRVHPKCLRDNGHPK